jgi:phosphate transport system substrate-binding protein
MARLVRFSASAALGFLAVVAAPSPRASAAQVTLAETGSTLIYPVFRIWAADYPNTHPGVAITAAPTDSGAGVEQAISGAAQIGVSDAYMSDTQVRDNPLIINVPMAISAQTVNYNIPDLNGQNLKLDGPSLAGIYSGKIQARDDPAIVAINTGVKLPHNPIVPIHRSDVSGDTFIFTQYLTFTTPSWEYSPGYGTTIAWPAAPSGLTADGNAGMIAKIHDTPYSVGYVWA